MNFQHKDNEYDYVILGGGITGLCVAYQLIQRNKAGRKILIIEKESKLGMHTSGRNSGVLHAGVYYKPGSIKARVCTKGVKRLSEWIEKRKININRCGKIIVPQENSLEKQLVVLEERATQNGAKVSFIGKKEISKLVPCISPNIKRALWSPNTAVVNPKEVISSLEGELLELGVSIMRESRCKIMDENRSLTVNNEIEVSYGHLINCTGLHADKIAKLFGAGMNYEILPFKGIYWKLSNKSDIKFNTNLYPVPDLNLPFLGIHFTPTGIDPLSVSIGPTATVALGRENYKGLEDFDIKVINRSLSVILGQYISNKGNFRGYIHSQSLLLIKSLMMKEARKLIPSIKDNDIVASDKVGIRSQLYDKKTKQLVDDFICESTESSTHVLNAVSPAFSSSFELADLILDKLMD